MRGNKNIGNGIRECPECHSTNVERETDQEEFFCSNCGLIIE
jgi:transcription initiation factor TFIIIB Brf1 subunit/transcription initiation factor TFIIB